MMGMQRPSRRRGTLSSLTKSLSHRTGMSLPRRKSQKDISGGGRKGGSPQSPERPIEEASPWTHSRAKVGGRKNDGSLSNRRLAADLSLPDSSTQLHDKPLPFRFISEIHEEDSFSQSSREEEKEWQRGRDGSGSSTGMEGMSCRLSRSSNKGGDASAKVRGDDANDPCEAEVTELRWQLRRAEEEAAAHRKENADLRRRLVEADARAAGQTTAPKEVSSAVQQSVTRGNAVSCSCPSSSEDNLVEKGATSLKRAVSAPSMCETDADESSAMVDTCAPLSSSSAKVVTGPTKVDTEHRKMVENAVEHVDRVLKRIAALASAEEDAASSIGEVQEGDIDEGDVKFEPPKMVSVPSNHKLADLTAEGDTVAKETVLPEVVSLVSPSHDRAPRVETVYLNIEQDNGSKAEEPPEATEASPRMVDKLIVTVDKVPASTMESGKTTASKEDDVLTDLSGVLGGGQESSATPRKDNRAAKSLLAELSFLTVSDGGDNETPRRNSEGRDRPEDEESWAPVGMTRDIFDDPSIVTADSSVRLKPSSSSSVAGESLISRASSSWQPVGDTKMHLSGDLSLTNASLVSASASSWKPVGATRGEIAAEAAPSPSNSSLWGSFAAEDDGDDEVGLFYDEDEVKDKKIAEANEEASACGSWMPAGETGNLFQQEDDDTESLASVSTWDTKSTKRSFRSCRSAVSGLTNRSALFSKKSSRRSRCGSDADERSEQTSTLVWELYHVQGLLRSVLEETDRSKAAEI